jgi:hypothetical protein
VLRDFDTKHDPNHEDKVVVRVLAKSSHTVAEMEAVFRALDPPCRNIKAIPHDARKN